MENEKRTRLKKLRMFLKKKNGSVRAIDIVNDLNIPRSAISQYLSGLYEPKIERVKQLADYFGVDNYNIA